MVFCVKVLRSFSESLAKSCLTRPTTCFRVLTSSEVFFRLLAKSIEADLIEAADCRLP